MCYMYTCMVLVPYLYMDEMMDNDSAPSLHLFPPFPAIIRYFQKHTLTTSCVCFYFTYNLLLSIPDFTISISTSLTFKYVCFQITYGVVFFLPAVDLRNEPVSNGFPHSANHFYVFSKAAFPSSPLPCVSTAASLLRWESITPFHRKLNMHSNYCISH